MKKITAMVGAFVIAGSLMGASYAPPPEGGNSDAVAEYLAQHPGVQLGDKAALSLPSVAVVGKHGEILTVLRRNEVESSQSAAVASAAACGYSNSTYVTTSYVQSLDGCGIIGYDKTATWYYDWYQPANLLNAGPVCTQGRGYFYGNNVTRWFNAGCGKNGGTSAYIGNVITVAKMRGYIVALSTFGYTRWR